MAFSAISTTTRAFDNSVYTVMILTCNITKQTDGINVTIYKTPKHYKINLKIYMNNIIEGAFHVLRPEDLRRALSGGYFFIKDVFLKTVVVITW